jgi:hypothetical protein
MAFEREDDVTKDAIGDYEVKFLRSQTGPDTGEIETQIIVSSGEIFTRRYNLIARLQDDAEGLVHLANLIALRDYLDIRLDNEVLPL